MINKVRVFGKAQNRTALGIINAYHVMFPHATFEDFEKAFPKELNPDSGWPVNFKRLEECQSQNERDFWFIEDGEVVKLQDGTNLVLCKMWTAQSFERLVSHATQYGIEVAEFEKTMKGQKGGFRLEYLNGYIPPVPNEKKSLPAWIWVLIALAVIAVCGAIYFMYNNEPVVEEKIVEMHDTIVAEVHDTVLVQEIEELETNFNAAQFIQGKAELSEEAKLVLNDIAALMEKNGDVKLKIEGHTSAEGKAKRNQELSEQRAKAAVDYLVEQGVAEDRLSYEGKGSS